MKLKPLLAAALLCLEITLSAHAQVPTLVTVGGEFDTVGSVFQLAVSEVYANIRRRNVSGPTLLFAGADYQGPWTRDASINVTQGSILVPSDIAENTLFEVTDAKQGIIIGQYWDKIIWATAAWRHYLHTGNKAFLARAYPLAAKTLSQQIENEFDAKTGLFRGPAVYGDGVAAYDDRYTQTGDYKPNGAWLSNVDKWPEANPTKKVAKGWGLPLFTLSTNCVYAGALQALDSMATVLHKPEQKTYTIQYQNLKKAIRAGFWPKGVEGNVPLYYFDAEEKSNYQEGLGIAFAKRFGIISGSELASMPVTSSANGICCVFPSYPRYTALGGLGRHSGVIWPMVNGFYAVAHADAGQAATFGSEFRPFTNNTWRDRQFREIYHPTTSQAYGGLQEDGFQKGLIREWLSTYRQTWSATAWIAMMLEGVIGIHYTSTGLQFKPVVPAYIPSLSLQNLPYRNALYNIEVSGHGKSAKVYLDGKLVQSISGSLKGKHNLRITLE